MIWDFQERQSSVKTQRKRVSKTWVKASPLMGMSKSKQSLFCQGPKTINLVLDILRENLFTANQAESL